jgi:hypothetical protein
LSTAQQVGRNSNIANEGTRGGGNRSKIKFSKIVTDMLEFFFNFHLVNHVRGQWRRDGSDRRLEEPGDTKASRGALSLRWSLKVYSEIQDTQADVHQWMSMPSVLERGDNISGKRYNLEV